MRRSELYPVILTIRLDRETFVELDDIARYSRKRKSVFVRDVVIELVQRYRRNSDYRQFKKELRSTGSN